MADELNVYRHADGLPAVQLRAREATVWLTQAEIADLYGTSVSNVAHITRRIIEDGEIDPATFDSESIVRTEGTRQVTREIRVYNLDMILAIGYRVTTWQAVTFRQWATSVLKEYLVKGFALDDTRLKGEQADYFDELLARIRDIRSSEKRFYQKVRDLFAASSIDYDPKSGQAKEFFATIQNKMHWAAHGHTAAELIVQRVDAQAPNMGLTNWTGANRGAPVRKADVGIAKNYLNADELDTLNRIVTAYIEVAELQAQARQPMTMRDWAQELDNFLRLTRKDILTHAGKVSAETALAKAQAAYVEYRTRVRDLPTRVDKDFEDAIAQPVKQLQKSRKALPNKKKGEQA